MNVFTYGTLMFSQVLAALTGRNFEFEDLFLTGWERLGLTGKTYPGLIENPMSSVEGRVWFDLDDESMLVLERFEDHLYERKNLVLNTQRRGVTHALAYVVPVGQRDKLTNTDWDKDGFEKEKLDNFVLMCEQFRKKVSDAR